MAATGQRIDLTSRALRPRISGSTSFCGDWASLVWTLVRSAIADMESDAAIDVDEFFERSIHRLSWLHPLWAISAREITLRSVAGNSDIRFRAHTIDDLAANVRHFAVAVPDFGSDEPFVMGLAVSPLGRDTGLRCPANFRWDRRRSGHWRPTGLFERGPTSPGGAGTERGPIRRLKSSGCR